MAEMQKIYCSECVEGVDRRDFMKKVGVTAGVLAAGSLGHPLSLEAAPAPANYQPKPAEDLVRELYASLSEDQKRQVVFAWNHEARQRMYNAAFARRVSEAYNAQQQELVERILKSICNGDEGYQRISRNNTFDGSRAIGGCGAYIFGDPTNNRQFAWVFMGHHLTIRCDGNSQPNAAFGGPLYYGHSPDGYSQRNVFNYQTRAVQAVYEALNAGQREKALVTGNPGEHEASIRFRDAGQNHPGIAAGDLTADQRRLVEEVMRTLLNPYRQEDGDEVMQILRRNGGLEKIHLAFYKDRGSDDNARWHFWRLEGPGFVWNFRVLPHVHTYVNIAAQA